jgi:hypothetical protein
MSIVRPANAERFVFQGLDPATGSVNVERLVFITDVAALRRVIGDDADVDPDWRRIYDLEPGELMAIGELCQPAFLPDPVFTRLERWSPLNDVPYLVHTNFELPLMLDGRKPLAVFGDAYPSDWFDDYLAPFELFVCSKTIVRRIIDEPVPKLKARHPALDGIRHVYFALPGEEWRIEAYIALMASERTVWTDELERRSGELLGYTDWQNDWWLENRPRRPG